MHISLGQALPTPPGPNRPKFVQQPNSPVVTELGANVCLFWQIEYSDIECTKAMEVLVVSSGDTFMLGRSNPENDPFDYNLNITEECHSIMNKTTTVVNVTLIIVMSENLFADYTRCNIFNNTNLLIQSKEVNFTNSSNATTAPHMAPTTTDCPPMGTSTYTEDKPTDTQPWLTTHPNSALSIRPCLSLLIIHWGIVILLLSTFMST